MTHSISLEPLAGIFLPSFAIAPEVAGYYFGIAALLLFFLFCWLLTKSAVARSIYAVARFIVVALVTQTFFAILALVIFTKKGLNNYVGILLCLLSLTFAWLDWRSAKKRDEKNNAR
jgi:hypothetical protein